MKRVVITGIAGISPLGSNWSSVKEKLRAGMSAVTSIPEWQEYAGLKTSIGAPVTDFELPAHYDRKRTRSMGRVAILATRASELALEQAGLIDDPVLRSGEVGVAFGSCLGGPVALIDLAMRVGKRDVRGTPASSYLQVMSHSCAVNIGIFFGLTGRVIPTCSACTSGSQAIGYSYEAIRSGAQRIMIAGGAEELCAAFASLFDSVCATSSTEGIAAPKPFDKSRSGIVVGEGAGAFVLEEYESARARGAHIFAEIVGFGTNSDGAHITNPQPATMQQVMQLALKDAQLSAREIGLVHAHATGTELGDIAESQATAEVFGDRTPVTALKSYMGHALGACGALESWMCLSMAKEGWIAPILHLSEPDPRCAKLDYVRGEPREGAIQYVMNNSFAFGGVNTSLIYKI